MIELIISIGIASILMTVAYEFAINGMNSYRQSVQRGQSNEQVRRAIDSMISVMREVRAADNGAYAIVDASANSFTFYANVDADGAVEQVKYSLNGTNLQQTVINPVNTPAQYTGAGVTTVIVSNVRSLQFNYYDKNYSGTEAALTQPVVPTTVRLVQITATVDDNPSAAPSAVTLTTSVMLRNLKDNL